MTNKETEIFVIYSCLYGEIYQTAFNTKEEAEKCIKENPWDAEEIIYKLKLKND